MSQVTQPPPTLDVNATTIVWFRQDLRVADNPALSKAAAHGAVVPVLVWAPHGEDAWPPAS